MHSCRGPLRCAFDVCHWLLATVARAKRSECSDTIHSLGTVSGSPFQAVLMRIEFLTFRACCHGAPAGPPPLARGRATIGDHDGGKPNHVPLATAGGPRQERPRAADSLPRAQLP